MNQQELLQLCFECYERGASDAVEAVSMSLPNVREALTANHLAAVKKMFDDKGNMQ